MLKYLCCCLPVRPSISTQRCVQALPQTLCLVPLSVWLQRRQHQPSGHGHSAGLHAPAGQPGHPEHHLPLQEQHRLHGRRERQPEEGSAAAGFQRRGTESRGQQPLHVQCAGGRVHSKGLSAFSAESSRVGPGRHQHFYMD